MQFQSKSINASIMETLTSGLYDGNINCIREYIQNAVDAKPKNIWIKIENSVNIVIKDDGIGMDKEELTNALYLGYSAKGENETGWRGIGIYSGVPNFKKITIITRKQNCKKLKVEIDAFGITGHYRDEIDIITLLRQYGISGDIEETEDDDFNGTTVRLDNILINQKDNFTSEKIKFFIVQNIPLLLRYNLSFKDLIIDFLSQYGIHEPTYSVHFKGEKDKYYEKLYRPPTDDSFFLSETFMSGVFKNNNNNLAVYWAITNKANKGLAQPNRGLSFRKKGFRIGNETTVGGLVGKYKYWNFGEIHVIDNEIMENSARNNFELNSNNAQLLFNETKKLIENFAVLNYKKSSNYKEDTFEKIEQLLKSGKSKEAGRLINKTEKALNIKRSSPSMSEFDKVSSFIEAKRQEGLTKIKKYQSINEKESEDNEKKEIENILKGVPKKKQSLAKKFTSGKGTAIEETVFDDIIKQIKKQIKGKSKETEPRKILEEAFGITFNKGGLSTTNKKTNILLIPSGLLEAKNDRKSLQSLDRISCNFGIFIYELYDIFVNGTKHYPDVLEKYWFDNQQKKAEFIKDFFSTIELIEMIIKKMVPKN